MAIALYILGALLILVRLVGLVLPALPGAPLMFLGVLAVAWADGFNHIGLTGLIILGALAALISVVDFLSEFVGAKKFGASYWGMIGAFLGLLAGLPFGIIGIILGPIALAILFEYLKDPDFKRAARVGIGALLGFVVGTALKYTLAFVFLGIAILAFFF